MDIKLWSLNVISIACWLHYAVHGSPSADRSDGSRRHSKSLWRPHVSPDWFQWKIKKKDDISTVGLETAAARDYGGDYYAPAKVDFSPLFLALVPIALFLGAAAALALATVTTPNQAVASAAQQQQQQQENNNNNNNANNNNNNLMAALMAAFASFYTSNNNYQNYNYPYIIVINGTGRALSKRSAFGDESQEVLFESLEGN